MRFPQLSTQLIDRLKSQLSLPYGVFSGDDLVTAMAAIFPWEYGADKGVREGYTLRLHTMMVLRQYDRYFAWQNLPVGIDDGLFRLILALHDIGTPHAIYETGDKRNQHVYTVEMMRFLLETMEYPPEDIAMALAIVSGDPIGRYLKGRVTGASTCAELARLAQFAGRELAEFLGVLMTYYQVDAGAYTADADGIEALDFLFDFDRAGGVMRFALAVEAKLGCLTAYAQELPHSLWLTDHEWHDIPACSIKDWARHSLSDPGNTCISDGTFAHRVNSQLNTFQVRLAASSDEVLYSPHSMPLYDNLWHTISVQDMEHKAREDVRILPPGQVIRGRIFHHRQNRQTGEYEVRLTRRLSDALYCK
ncbi:MAG: hypothetical protein JW846_06460 [Dehalococcoidia bacterium]|nr:hypothetical protein [Dehalococcoidia bacterium]